MADPNPFPRFTFLWDLHGNTKGIGRLYVSFRRGKGAGWPIQRTWANEVGGLERHGHGVGVRFPRLMVSFGVWSTVSQSDWDRGVRPRSLWRGRSSPKDLATLPVASRQDGGGRWDVLADS